MTQEINPNKNVLEESGAESKIGEVTSFQQLDRITDEQIRQEKQAKKEAKAQAKAEAQAEVPDEANSDDGAGDESGGDHVPESADSRVQADDQSSEAQRDANIDPTFGIDPEKIRPIKVSVGDEQLNLLPTTEIPVKIDGEKQGVPLQDLINEYSGKTAWDKRFSDLNREKQKQDAEISKWNKEKLFVEGKIANFFVQSEQDPITALDSLCELTGRDPIEFQKSFRDNLVKQFEEYYNLDDIGRREYDLTQRERYLEAKRQAEHTKAERQKQQQAEEAQISQALQTYGMTEDQYDAAYTAIKQANPSGQIELEHVIRYDRALLAQKVVKEVKPEKAEDAQVLGEIATVLVQNPEFKEDDVKDILREIWKEEETSQASKTLSKKVLKTQSQAKPDRKPQEDDVFWRFDQV